MMLCPDLPGTSSGLFAVLSQTAGSDSKSDPRVGAHMGMSFPHGGSSQHQEGQCVQLDPAQV